MTGKQVADNPDLGFSTFASANIGSQLQLVLCCNAAHIAKAVVRE